MKPVKAAGAVSGAAEETIDPADGGTNVHVAGLSKARPPRTPRALAVDNVTLPNDGTFLTVGAGAPLIDIPDGAQFIGVAFKYTAGNHANCYARIRVMLSNGTEECHAVAIDPTLTVIGVPAVSQPIYASELVTPKPGANTAMQPLGFTVDVRGGWTKFRVTAAEQDGTKATPGAVTVAYNVGY